MALSSFAIQFQFASHPDDAGISRRRQHVYQANINTLSRAFKLFEVTGIKKITKSKVIELPGAYYLTSYPLCYAGNQTWKDAVTTNSDEFLQAIGGAIENYLTTPAEAAYGCLN
jgi:hypothetical protein